MKTKYLGILCALLLLAVSCAGAEDLSGYSMTSANVTAVSFVDIVAPCSGTLASFDLQAGDPVSEGQVLFSMLTTPVYAPESGTVKAVFVQTGEDTSWAMGTYGMVMAIEPDMAQYVACTTTGAYNDAENKTLHVGETLYFQSAKGDKEEGTGMVAAVNGDSYTVFILTGSFDEKETLSMHRKDSYNTRDCVGKGTVARRSTICVAASGIAAEVAVEEGAHVSKGDCLLRALSADAEANTAPDVTAAADGVLASVPVVSGQQVWKGELLCRVYLTDALEVTADVDEVDLHGLKVGDEVKVTLDTAQSKVLDGTVTEISALGVTRQNAALYTVHVSLNGAGDLMLGQSASLYLPKE